MPKGTTSKERVETRSYSKKLFFMVKFPKFLGSPTYIYFITDMKVGQQTVCILWSKLSTGTHIRKNGTMILRW